MRSGALGRIYSGRLPARHLPSATQRGRGEGWVRGGGHLSPPRLFRPLLADHLRRRIRDPFGDFGASRSRFKLPMGALGASRAELWWAARLVKRLQDLDDRRTEEHDPEHGKDT